MSGRWVLRVAVLCGLLGAVDAHGASKWPRSGSYPRGKGTYWRGRSLGDLTIEEQRKLGLSDAQIRKIAEKRRELERQRKKLEEKLDAAYRAARDAARAANAEARSLRQQLNELGADKIDEAFRSVMTKEQLDAWNEKRRLELAKRWLTSYYKRWLKLTDAQVGDISLLLVPVFEKFENLEDEVSAARERLAELRGADEIDIAAIEAAEKEVAELDERKRHVYSLRRAALKKAMRAGLMPEQLERLDKRRYGR